jgi:serine kinase of HPr protein (carbohydrate metabolism regulator)
MADQTDRETRIIEKAIKLIELEEARQKDREEQRRRKEEVVRLPGEEWAIKLADLSSAERTAEVAKVAYRLFEAATWTGDWREARLTLEWLMQLAPKAKGAGHEGGGSPL